MTRKIQPGALQDDARREVDGVLDQRAQQIDPAGRHRVDLNQLQSNPPAREVEVPETEADPPRERPRQPG